MGRCGMEQPRLGGGGSGEARLYAAGASPLGWGQEEGVAGVPGEVTLLPHICVPCPSPSHTHTSPPQMHSHPCTETHMCLQLHT